MQINQKEIDSIIKLESSKRYQYFLKKVADNECMYALCNRNDDFALSSIENHTLFAIWPFEEYVNLCKIDEWFEYDIIKIDFEKFEEVIRPLISKRNYLINVFPISNTIGFIVEFIRDLKAELEQYE